MTKRRQKRERETHVLAHSVANLPRVGDGAVLVDVGQVDGRLVPRHIDVVPLHPDDLLAVGRHPRAGVEVGSTGLNLVFLV